MSYKENRFLSSSNYFFYNCPRQKQYTIQLTEIIKNGDVMKKRQLIGSIYPEKLTFDGLGFRTAHINEVVYLLQLIYRELKRKKWDKSVNF